MIDLDEIESAARKPWYCRSKLEDNLLSPEVLVELITRLRQAEKDAARYRWLRDSGVENLFSYQQEMRSKYWNEDIDAEIEAMQCNK